jgi:condensin complex subunit 2
MATMVIDDDAGGMPAWNTQFMQGDEDDNDTPDFEEEGLGALTGAANLSNLEEDDLLAATQGQLKRVRPDNVNYAKRAKRVDVKKLKDSIWDELEEVTIKVKEVCSSLFSFYSMLINHCVRSTATN